MSPDLIIQIVSVVIVLIMFAAMIFSKRLHYFIGGVILIAVGVVTILFEVGVLKIDLTKFAIVNFAVYSMIVFAGKDLIKEGFKENESVLKWPSIIMGFLLIAMTTLPTLTKLKVIDWALPKYPPVIDAGIYITAGVLLIIGVFTLLSNAE